MPDESCRKCGNELKEYSVCAKCRAVNQFYCEFCMFRTEIQFHDGICFNEIENYCNEIMLGHTAKPAIIAK